jgi:AhpD family alkylhydroperoxidase
MHAHETLEELGGQGRALREQIPEVYSAYVHLSSAAMKEGLLPVKFKELLALVIGVTRECDGCIASHARGAARAGASAAEVAEALGVAVMMNGGPGTVWGPRAFAAFEEYAASPSE